jgi:hypothetical protein
LILSFIVSHQPSIFNPDTATTISFHTLTNLNVDEYITVYSKIETCISGLLYKTLRNLLQELQTLIFRRNREDWPTICFSLSLLFFAAESLQVDIFLHADNREKGNKSCDAMQVNGIYVLTELFLASAAGFNPLILDWDLEQNQQLLGNNIISIEALKKTADAKSDILYVPSLLRKQPITANLGFLGTFLRDRKKIEFTFADTDCLTGKLTARILQA